MVLKGRFYIFPKLLLVWHPHISYLEFSMLNFPRFVAKGDYPAKSVGDMPSKDWKYKHGVKFRNKTRKKLNL